MSTSEFKHKTLFIVYKQPKENTIIYRRFGYHDEACTWHHFVELPLAGDGSHSTDQPVGKVHDQVKPAIISSKDTPENIATSKAGYTNSQQGLPD
jgi:hypothetical protein